VQRGDVTEQMRLLAANHGVSERTAWRWRKTMRKTGSIELLQRPRLCDYCGRQLPDTATIRRRYCPGANCGQYHRRERNRRHDAR
jgi:hypothetical protein